MTTLTLLVDDVRTFADPDDTCIIKRTSQEAIELLTAAAECTHWRRIYLDHDLGVDKHGYPDTTWQVVDFLCEHAFYYGQPLTDEVVLVTMNPVGRDRMVQALRRFYRVTLSPGRVAA